MNGIINSVLAWSHARNIIKGSTAKDQYLKMCSESGELAELHSLEEIIDDIGDMQVCLINLLAQSEINIEEVYNYPVYIMGSNYYRSICLYQGRLADALLKNNKKDIFDVAAGLINVMADIAVIHNFTLEQALEKAYNSIKDRKGIMYNGAFIKDSDPNYERILKEVSK